MSITYKEYNEQYRLPEQEQAEKLLMKHKHFVLGWEPGKSKSYPVIHCIIEVQKLKQRPIKVLIMSDATCIKDMWKAEIGPQGILPRETYFVTDRTAIGNVKPALVATNWDVIVVDECQSLRSGVTRAKSKFAKLVYALTKRTEYVFGMTGTISGNNNIEPWCILHNLNVAGMGEINCHLFKDRYCVQELGYGPFGNFMRPTKLNESGEALMNKAYENGVMFWGYDDDDDMPPMNVEMKTFAVEATETYKDALEGILKCGEYESTMQKALAIQKAQQALNGFIYYDVEGVRHIYTVGDYVNPKLKYIGDESEKKPLIIAYRFQEDGESIKYELDKRHIKHCSDITEFKKHLQNNEHYILVLQCSRGKSVNLQECQDIIYYSSDFSFISYKQLIHRCWRRGQTNPCNVTFLINDPGDKHKVEEKIWKSLRTKQSIHDTLMAIRRTD